MIQWDSAVLYSGNKQLLSHFLGQLLELDVAVSEKDIELKGDQLKLIIKEGDRVNREPGPSFVFEVASLAELEEIKNKSQFIEYSLTSGQKVWGDEVKVEKTPSGYSMEVIDPDGRIWLFTAKE